MGLLVLLIGCVHITIAAVTLVIFPCSLSLRFSNSSSHRRHPTPPGHAPRPLIAAALLADQPALGHGAHGLAAGARWPFLTRRWCAGHYRSIAGVDVLVISTSSPSYLSISFCSFFCLPLALHAQGHGDVSAPAVLDLLIFEGFAAHSPTPASVRAAIERMAEVTLRRQVGDGAGSGWE